MATREITSTGTGASAISAVGLELSVRITPVIERDFKRRGVFPELRLGTADLVLRGATAVHRVSTGRAKELLADTQAMRTQSHALPRGLPAAYMALMRNIGSSLKQEAKHGLWDDPGKDAAAKRMAQSSALFHVGDAVLHFDDGEEYGDEATIIGEYKMYAVANEDGPYVNDQLGVRGEYRRGYVINCKGSDRRFFSPAHRLTRDDCKPSHLRLVASRLAAALC